MAVARFVSMLNDSSAGTSAHGVYCTQQKPHSCRMHAEYLQCADESKIGRGSARAGLRSYLWFWRWLSPLAAKLKVVILPVRPVWYCRQQSGGLDNAEERP